GPTVPPEHPSLRVHQISRLCHRGVGGTGSHEFTVGPALNETNVLALHLFRQSQAGPSRRLAGLIFAQITERKQGSRKIVSSNTPKHVGLILSAIHGPAEYGPRRRVLTAGVVARRYGIETETVCASEQAPELEMRVASHARIGRF